MLALIVVRERRQLEALVRISEAIAKMRLAKFASLGDVEEGFILL
jgi:DNA replicative helicase MCM subunit Mcm2 (Cdc46/Mcm family)